MRIVIEFNAADGRATVTTEPHPQGEGMQAATATGLVGAAEATDAGPPAEGMPLAGRAAAVVAVDAGPAPDAGGAVDGVHA
ncbi:MAG TPA: hypothetical protein VIX41_09865 [Acidimicrobiales bacterium]